MIGGRKLSHWIFDIIGWLILALIPAALIVEIVLVWLIVNHPSFGYV